ncbi:MAG: PaaI family thioesterase [Ilumatobacteraceae bacterium]
MTSADGTAPGPYDLDPARIRAGRAIRDLGHTFAGHSLPAADLERVADAIESLISELESGTPRRRDPASFGDHRRYRYEEGPILHTYADRPICGMASPWGLDPELHRHGDEIEAVVTLRAAHEGAPGRSHGGIVAALFDDVFGFVLSVVDEAAFTGRLTITYRAGTPLHEPIACRVRATGKTGRKITMTGELTVVATGRLLAEADALFITVDPTMFAASAQRPAPPDEGG